MLVEIHVLQHNIISCNATTLFLSPTTIEVVENAHIHEAKGFSQTHMVASALKILFHFCDMVFQY